MSPHRSLFAVLALLPALSALPCAAARPAPLAQTDEAGLLAAVEALEYCFAADGAGLVGAPNRAQDLRLELRDGALRVAPRVPAPDAGWSLALATVAWGAGDTPAPVEAGSLAFEGAELRVERPGLVEWVRNEPRGVEHGWTILAAPPGATGDAAWTIDVDVAGLLPQVTADGRAARLRDPAGRHRLWYRGLASFDAAGAPLPSWMEGRPGGLRIHVDARGAALPITVDPTLSGPLWQVESNQSGARYGEVVSTAGDVNGDGFSDVVVASTRYDDGQTDEGRVFVYHGSPSGPSLVHDWSYQLDQANAELGRAVSAAGDVNGDGFDDLLVGASLYDGDLVDEGLAMLFLGSPSGLEAAPAWTREGDQAGCRFGFAVAPAGDVNGDGYADVLVGAHLYDAGQADEGRAFLFLGSPSGLGSGPDWTFDGDQDEAWFGYALSTAGDVNADGFSDVIIGAPLWEQGEVNEGGAWLFLGSSFFGLSPTPAWTGQGNKPDDQYGFDVGLAGDINGDGYGDILIGQPFGYYGGFNGTRGEVHVHLGNPAGVSLLPDLNWLGPAGTNGAAQMGYSLTTAGDVNGDGYADVLIGLLNDFAQVRLHLGSDTGISTTPSQSVTGPGIGYSVYSAGDVNGDGYSDVILGAPTYSSGQGTEGTAWIYTGSAEGLIASDLASAQVSLPGPQPGADFGAVVRVAGDVNGDGFSDLLVGAPRFDGGLVDEGRAFLFLGSELGYASAPSWTADGGQAGALFGSDLAAAGDVDGDGYADVIVSAPGADGTHAAEGRAYVFHGSPAGLAAGAAWTVEGAQAGASLLGVATAGDVDGDGFADVLVGVPAWDGAAGADCGRAALYLGASGGLAPLPAWELEGSLAAESLGARVAFAGDVSADGYADFLVSSPGYSDGQASEGRVQLFAGAPEGPATAPAWSFAGNFVDAQFGYALAHGGDVNADGYSDVLVGAPGYHNGQPGEGWCFLFSGGPGGLSAGPTWIAESNQAMAGLGSAVAFAGDLNGDGFGDVAIGAPGYDGALLDAGRVQVHYGSSAGPSSIVSWSVEGDAASGALGTALAGGGDGNGDGYADLAVGQPAGGGAVSVFQGNAGGSGVRAPRQLQPDGVTPLDLFGRSTATDAFVLSASPRSLAGFAGTPAGMSRVYLEYQVKPDGEAFGSDGIVRGTNVVSTGPVGSLIDLFEDVPGLETGQRYRWRARVATEDVHFPHSPWFSLPWNAATETKLRTFADCNGNQVLDSEDIAGGTSLDCDGNGVPDECDPDCNGNGVPDACDLGSGTSPDCNANGLPDECDVAAGSSSDCDGNGVPDECDPDCTANGIPDACDIASGTAVDCNGNGVPDECDIAGGTSVDADGNGVPDECQGVGTAYCFGQGCPCGNDDPAAGCANSSGSGALLESGGSASVALDDLVFHGSNLIPNQPGLLFVGQDALNGGAGFPFGDGLRCAGTGVIRLGIETPDGAGEADWGPGLGALAGWSAGDLRRFQCWYRNPAGGPCATGFNLTNGIEVQLAP